MTVPAGPLIIIAVCIVTQGFFSGAEMALVNANRAGLKAKADDGDVGAARALVLLSEEERLLGTCLIGTNLSVVTSSTATASLWASLGVAEGLTTTLTLLPFVLIFGEALPKTVFQWHATTLAPLLAGPLTAFQVLFAPALWLVSNWGRALSLLTGGSGRAFVTRDDLKSLLEGSDNSTIALENRKIIQRVLALNEKPVIDCMTPLIRVHALDEDSPVDEAVAVATRTGHSRLPVYRERVDNLVGYALHLDLLYATDGQRPLKDIMRPIKFVPESKRADQLLNDLRRSGEHLAVIVDEYGGSIGIVTVEDLLEEVVGEIHDERDPNEPAIRRLAEKRWRVPARTWIDEVNQVTGAQLPEGGEYDTVAGLILRRAGRIPEPGETLEIAGAQIRVVEANERAILTVHLMLP
jgi:putative hemolysin